MDAELIWIWGGGLALTVATCLPFILRLRRREQNTALTRAEALRAGLDEPASLHPVVDPGRCIGTGGCVAVCPEGVIGFEDGQAVAVAPARCVGHGLCERACPVEAISLVFGTESRGVELPRVKGNFETNVRGLYVVGELGGMGLVANAFEQGRQCAEGILGEDGSGPEGIEELVVVGCGPAGLSTALTARHGGIRPVVLEKEELGGTVGHYPRKKMVMTRPVRVPGFGRLGRREIGKEELVELWREIAEEADLAVRTGVAVTGVDRVGPLHFRVTTSEGPVEAARVVLAVGRRGVPRKLGVPGEDRPSVAYGLREPEAYAGDRVVVVGGGDSAVEAALALVDQPGTEVRLSYRRHHFRRIKPANLERIEAAAREGRIQVLFGTEPVEIGEDAVVLRRSDAGEGEVGRIPADQTFVFIGGELPTAFLRRCGVEIETKFGEP